MSVEKKVDAGRWKTVENRLKCIYLRPLSSGDGGVAGQYMAWKAQQEAGSADESSEM